MIHIKSLLLNCNCFQNLLTVVPFNILGPVKNISEAKERQLVAALSRQDLEDRYLRLREDHVVCY